MGCARGSILLVLLLPTIALFCKRRVNYLSIANLLLLAPLLEC